jgi:broad specificity phosphatase PhoE
MARLMHAAGVRWPASVKSVRFTRPGLSPALRARQTAEGIGLSPEIEPLLRDLDYGRWAGRPLVEIEREDPAGLAAWLSDPRARAHGGESVEALVERVGSWLAGLGPEGSRIAAVTHAAVMRAAILHVMGAPPPGSWRIDIAPLCVAELRGGGGRWTLRSLTPPARKAGLQSRRAEPRALGSAG